MTGQLGSRGDGEGQGSALPTMAPSCSTQPEEQSKDGDGDQMGTAQQCLSPAACCWWKHNHNFLVLWQP